MPRLSLLRHGPAEAGGANPSLSQEGAEMMRLEALGMAKLGLRFDEILSSPLQRAGLANEEFIENATSGFEA